MPAGSSLYQKRNPLETETVAVDTASHPRKSKCDRARIEGPESTLRSTDGSSEAR